jgi:hypothetical protein
MRRRLLAIASTSFSAGYVVATQTHHMMQAVQDIENASPRCAKSQGPMAKGL